MAKALALVLNGLLLFSCAQAQDVSTAKRLPAFPYVPTAEEAGLPGYVVTTWYGIFAPAGTQPAIVARLHADTARYAKIVKDIGLRVD